MGNKNLDPSPFFIKREKNSFIFPLFLALKWESTIPELSSPFFSILKKMKKGNNHQSLILTSFAKKLKHI